MSALLRFVAFLLVALSASAVPMSTARAQALSASARVSPRSVDVGGRVAYTVTIRGASGPAVPAPPASGGLRAVQTLPTSDVTTQINGQVEREVTWTYEAFRAGKAQIGPAQIPIGSGRVLDVDVATVTVRSASGASPSGPAPGAVAPAPGERSDLFARVELSRERAVVGQQVVADVVLYFLPSLQPRQTTLTGSWDAPGFWREELDVASTVPRPTTVGGRAYDAVTLRRLALFPTRDGRLVLPPMTFSVDFLTVDPFDPYGNSPFGSFFHPFSSGFEERDVEAPSVSVDVSELPPGAPASFGGAVGQFTLSASPVPTAVAVGDPVQLRVVVSGTGNVATISAPTLVAPPGLDAFRPRDEADVDRSGREVRGTKAFTYTLVPQSGGRLGVPPAVWTFFDPEAGVYRTLRTDSLRLDVSGAAVAQSAPSRAPTGPAAGLLASPAWSRPGVPVGVLWAVLGAGLGVPAVALAAMALVRRRRRLAALDTPEARRRLALARATERLDAARTQSGPEAFAEAERAVLAFLADRHGIQATGLERHALAEALAEHDVPHDDRLLALLDALGAGQFAPGLAPLTAPAAIDEAAATLALVQGDAPAPRRLGRRRATVAALLLLTAGPAHAQDDADRLFELGTRLVAEGDTSGAVAAFEGAVAAGRADGRLSAGTEHNLGTLALGQGDAGRARLHTERASRLAPLDAAVAQNAALARVLAKAPPETVAARAWRVVTGVAGRTGLVALALALAYAALGLALARRRRIALPVGALALVAVVVAVTALTEASRADGVVLVATEVRDAAAPDAARAGSLAPGVVVRLGERSGAWQHVTGEAAEGWAPAASVEVL